MNKALPGYRTQKSGYTALVIRPVQYFFELLLHILQQSLHDIMSCFDNNISTSSLERKAPSRLQSFFSRGRSTQKDLPKNEEESISRSSSVSSTSSFRSRLDTSSFGKKVELLGTGISGKVELFYKKQTGEYFAVKTFAAKEPYESRDEYKSRCSKEFKILYNIGSTHDNVIRAYKFSSGLLSHQVVFEYVPFNFLRVVQAVRPGEDEIKCFFRQVCEGVRFLHSNYVSHRDLKMENLVMDRTGVVKIVDFGSAFYFGPHHFQASGLSGTESLTSPEAFKKIRYDSEANDVWGLAILLYSMLNLKFPWKTARESDSDFRKFLGDKYVLKDAYHEDLWTVVSPALELDVTERIKIDNLLSNMFKLVGSHLDCDKVHVSTLRICSKKFRIPETLPQTS